MTRRRGAQPLKPAVIARLIQESDAKHGTIWPARSNPFGVNLIVEPVKGTGGVDDCWVLWAPCERARRRGRPHMARLQVSSDGTICTRYGKEATPYTLPQQYRKGAADAQP